MPQLRVRKLADRSSGDRVERFHPVTGEKLLLNPDTCDPDAHHDEWADKHEPWPFAGLAVEGDPPDTCEVPVAFVGRGQEEGWLTLENPRLVKEGNQTFIQGDAVVLHTVDGDVRYRVAVNPGRHEDDSEPSGVRVDHFFTLELES